MPYIKISIRNWRVIFTYETANIDFGIRLEKYFNGKLLWIKVNELTA